jgi:hypothetical protein
MPRLVVSTDTQKIAILLVVFLASFALRLWLLDKRWVNPDEGAHLMDAVLVLDGKMPIQDFGSRQPFTGIKDALRAKGCGRSGARSGDDLSAAGGGGGAVRAASG